MDPMESSSAEGWDANCNPYMYQVTIDSHQQHDLFQGSSQRIAKIAGGGRGLRRNTSRELSVLYFVSDDCRQRYSDWATSTGACAYIPSLLFEENNNFYGIGKPAGIPLKKWMLKKNRTIWEFDYNGNYRKIHEEFAKVGRWLGAAVHTVHLSGQFVGNLMDSTFIDENYERVSFLRKDDPTVYVQSIADGIKRDMDDLSLFVRWVETKLWRFTTLKPRDIIQFEELYNAISNDISNFPTNISDLQSYSFFLCHTPLYWNFEQRSSFSYTYHSMRQYDSRNFDQHMPFQDRNTYIDDLWNQKLSSMESRFTKVLNNELPLLASGPSKMRHLLIPFFRNCFEHFNDELLYPKPDEDLDKQLYSNFPDAISKAYLEFFKTTLYSNGFKVSLLTEGPPTRGL